MNKQNYQKQLQRAKARESPFNFIPQEIQKLKGDPYSDFLKFKENDVSMLSGLNLNTSFFNSTTKQGKDLNATNNQQSKRQAVNTEQIIKEISWMLNSTNSNISTKSNFSLDASYESNLNNSQVSVENFKKANYQEYVKKMQKRQKKSQKAKKKLNQNQPIESLFNTIETELEQDKQLRIKFMKQCDIKKKNKSKITQKKEQISITYQRQLQLLHTDLLQQGQNNQIKIRSISNRFDSLAQQQNSQQIQLSSENINNT